MNRRYLRQQGFNFKFQIDGKLVAFNSYVVCGLPYLQSWACCAATQTLVFKCAIALFAL